MSFKYTAHFAWDLSLGQIRTSKKKKKTGGGRGGNQRDILNLKQKTMKSLPVCLDLYMFQCVSFFFYNIAEVVDEH